MAAPYPTSTADVLLFGSQALSFDLESFKQLRATLQQDPNHLWILETLEELPGLWERTVQSISSLQAFPGADLFRSLNESLRTGEISKAFFPLPNVLLTPLVVIAHLTQYHKFVEHNKRSFQDFDNAIGLCTGLLSARVVSSSRTHHDFQEQGRVALRLAMLIGALVDAQDTKGSKQGDSKSFSVAWLRPEASVQLTEILEEFPEVSRNVEVLSYWGDETDVVRGQAYISVVFDERRVTVTTSKPTADLLQQQLKDCGFIVAEIALKGRFHSLSNSEDTELLIKFCDSHSEFQFVEPLPSNIANGAHAISDFNLLKKPHADILRSILVTQSTWYQAFSTLLSSMATTNESTIVSFGTERCVPPSLSRTLGPRNIRVIEADSETESQLIKANSLNSSSRLTKDFMDQQVAVVGMSCLVPGAADLEEFSQLLQSGKSQHKEVPADRFGFQTAWRDQDPKRTWYGNFIQDFDTFDHKFFKKSPREMESTDPQHRLMLQVAYQAVQQSGYFHFPDRDKHIGCYVGVGLVDYENNIACYPANAYSATGNLKSFAAGKISHYFGWTGPGLTIDTACSSSAVAIHQACRAIQTGDCSAALAGGINLMTSPEWFQNLAGASFLSPTGQCKPFDSKADGYCRGEGVGAVFLKRLSTAVADGDQIMGVIGGTNVYQNQNCTAITVPNTVSLSDLFSNVVQKACLQPKHVTVVEAHGTGTQVGGISH